MPVVDVIQGSPEWLAYRRTVITGTAIPILLGLSPYRCEADLADEMLGKSEGQESTARMRIGSALEDFNLAEYEAATGCRAERIHNMVRHPSIEWAAASPDAQRLDERRLVELKWTTSRNRFSDGLPQDVEAQVIWQLGCAEYPVADVSVLTPDGLLPPFTVEANPALFADLVAVAEDFRRRLEEGGPFARDNARIRRDHPTDDGTEIEADGDLEEAVEALVGVRASIKAQKELEGALVERITTRMGPAAILRGSGWKATWKASRAPVITNWEGIATGLLRTLPETERDTLVGLHQTVGKAQRPFRVWMDKETE